MRMIETAGSAILVSMRCSTSAAGERRSRRRRLWPGFAVAGLLIGLLASSPLAEASAPRAYRQSFNRISVQLRLAIEAHPAELSADMLSSETVCGMAERSEARGESQEAQADWSTLSQAVHELCRRLTAGDSIIQATCSAFL